MQKKITCAKCKSEFEPNKKNQKIITDAIKKSMSFLMVECQNCGQYFSFNPIESHSQTTQDNKAITIRCPASRCSGWVSYIDATEDGQEFWGCGECGSIWHSKKNLIEEIQEITKKYKYRTSCYVLKDNDITQASPGNETKDYEDLVRSEDKDTASSFQRD